MTNELVVLLNLHDVETRWKCIAWDSLERKRELAHVTVPWGSVLSM